MIDKYLEIFKNELKINDKLIKQLLLKKKNIFLNNFENWDSITHVKILIKIEKNFKLKINENNESYFNDFQSGLSYLKKMKLKIKQKV